MDEQQEPKRRVRMERFTWQEGDLEFLPDPRYPRPDHDSDNNATDQQ